MPVARAPVQQTKQKTRFLALDASCLLLFYTQFKRAENRERERLGEEEKRQSAKCIHNQTRTPSELKVRSLGEEVWKCDCEWLGGLFLVCGTAKPSPSELQQAKPG